MRAVLLVVSAAAIGCAVDSTFPMVGGADTFATGASSLDVEVDVVGGARLDREAVRIAEQSFADVGIAARFAVSHDTALDVPEKLTDRATKRRLLTLTRDRPDHVHIVVAPRGAGAHGVTHYPLDSDDTDDAGDTGDTGDTGARPSAAGAFVFVDSIADDFHGNAMLADAGLALHQLVGRTLAHELGHTLGCPHGGDAESGTLMVQNSALGAVTAESLPRWQAALSGRSGYPAFAGGDRACLDLGAKLSVELARPAYLEER